MRHLLCRSTIVVLVLFAAAAAYAEESASDAEVDAAVGAAGRWVTLVDAGKYQESYERSASVFRAAVTGAQWEEAARAARVPLGKVISRELTGAQLTTTLPGAPEGRYVVIQYRTAFEKKPSAVETVTPMMDDGEWRISGYYIK